MEELYADGEATSYTVTLDGTADTKPTAAGGYESEAWKAEFVNLPKYKIDNGEKVEIVYTIAETTTYPGYTPNTTEAVASGGTITNTQEATTVKATKVWADSNNRAGKRDDVTFNLLADGKKVDSARISKSATGDDLTVTWENLPKYKAGTTDEIVYTVVEEGEQDNKITMNGVVYTVKTAGDATAGFTITNSYTPPSPPPPPPPPWGPPVVPPEEIEEDDVPLAGFGTVNQVGDCYE